MTPDAARRAGRLSTPAPLSFEVKTGGPRPAGQKVRAAIIAVHGMGQQSRHATMTSLAGRLFDMTSDPNTQRPKIQVVDRKMTKRRSQVCCEFTVPTVDGDDKDIAVFEAYWAPLTEGKIGFRGTVWFLFVSGLWGLWLTVKDAFQRHGFQRWIFDEVRNYGVSWGTFPLIAVTFAGTTGIVVVMMAALGVLGTKLAVILAQSFSSTAVIVHSMSLVTEIDALQTCVTAVTIPIVLSIALAALLGRLDAIAASPCFTKVVRWLLIGAVLLLAVFTGLCGLALVGVIAQALGTLILGHATGFDAVLDRLRGWVLWVVSYLPIQPSPTWGIALNLVMFGAVYFFGKQFVGDVAIYVSAHRVNRYWETRETIRAVAHQVAADVYGCADDGQPRYDEVYFVAHSLGSVIAYDTINAIFRDELVLGQPIDAVRRTKGLLTYGSPLDKTAFLFRAYSDGSVERLAAVAASQPLILAPAFRTLTWINIHSLADPFSAALEYYGPPGRPLVDNRDDPESFVPFLAHVQYEEHGTFRKALCEMLGVRRA